ncbi:MULTISPECIES: cupin-like domain-containing protein [Pacificimonas]|nr:MULTISPECIES: cupin-like domain-containing protein [Pacificimonas]MBZ6378078.1 cupin-like domain-containing protein [Pacificimonas aurantium]
MAKRKRKPAVDPAASALPASVRTEIAEALMLSEEPVRIARRLQARGLPERKVEAEIEAARKHPYLAGAERLRARVRKRDWLLRNVGQLAALRMQDRTIPRLRDLSPEAFFRDYYAANLPVVLEGMIDNWPAMSRWSLDYLEERLGDVPISIQNNRESAPDYEPRTEEFRETQPLPQVIERLRSGGPTNDFYVTANNSPVNKQSLAPLWEDVGELPGFLARQEERDGFFWMGPQGTITPFHHDLTNNLLVQIDGRKRVIMVPSWDTPGMKNYMHCYSEWTGEDFADGLSIPGRPQPWKVDIGPGDMLFIPIGWWHHVEGLSTTIGMSFTNFARDNDFYSKYDANSPL